MSLYRHITTGEVREFTEPPIIKAHLWEPYTPPAEPEPAPLREWDSRTFRNRFTQAERFAIIEAAKSDAVLVEAQFQAASSPTIHAIDPETQQYMAYLVGKGLITAERKAEILAD